MDSVLDIQNFLSKLHQHTSPKLLTIWSTHGNNKANNVVKFDIMVSNIVAIHHIINFDNIVTMYDNNIVTQYCEN